MFKLFRISILLIVFCTLAVFAQVPGQISWQGVLTDSNGDGLNGSYEITIRIFSSDDTVNDLTPLWEETYTKTLTDGLFNVIIGENSGNPLNISFDSQYWMEVEVDGDDAPLPRVKLTSSPYSLMSKTVEDGAITTPKLANDAVTTPKILDEAVTTDKIEDEAVTTEKIDDDAVISSKIADNTVVRSIGNPAALTDDVNLVEGQNVKIKNNFPNIDDIEISALGEIKVEVNIDNSVSIFVWNQVINNWNIWVIIFPNGNIWWFGPIIINNYIFVFNENNDSGVLIDPEDGIIIYDEDGNIVGWWRTDGTSEHWGLETFHEGVLVPLAGGGWIIIDEFGFTIYDADGNIVTDFAPDGTSFHKGKETFAGGVEIENEDGSKIVIDEDGITIYDSNGDVVGSWGTDGSSEHYGDEVFHEKIIKENEDGSSTVTDENGTTHTDADGNTTQTGPDGSTTTHTDPDTGETNTTTTGASGTTTTRTDDEGNESTTEVSPDGVKYTDADGNIIEIGPEGITIYDADGNLMTYFGKDGTSYHAGDEMYAGKITKVNEDGSMIEISDEGIKVYDENGDVVGGINADGSIIGGGDISLEGGFEVPLTGGGKLVVDETGIKIVDEDGNEMTVFNPDGTSYHAGKEIFAGGIEIPTVDGGKIVIENETIFFYDSDGNVLGGNLVLDGALGHFITNENGSIWQDPTGFKILDAEGNIVTEFNYDGTSYHAGLETFAGGARFPNEDGGETWVDESGIRIYDADGNEKLVVGTDGSIRTPTEGGGWTKIDENGITIYDEEGNVVTQFAPDGTSYHAGKEIFAGGLEVPLDDGGKILISPDGFVDILDAEGNPKAAIGSDENGPLLGIEGDQGSIVLDDNGLIIYDSEGNPVTIFEYDGTSYHSGKETFDGGLEVPLSGGGKITLNDDGIAIFDEEGNYVTHFNPTGQSYHTGLEWYTGGIFVAPNDASHSDSQAGTTLGGNNIKITDGSDGKTLVNPGKTEWNVDSFFDITYRIDLGTTPSSENSGLIELETPVGNIKTGFDEESPTQIIEDNNGNSNTSTASSIYIEIEGIPGESNDQSTSAKAGEIEVYSWSWGTSSPSKAKIKGGKIDLEDVTGEAGIYIKLDGVDGETEKKTDMKAGSLLIENMEADSFDPMFEAKNSDGSIFTLYTDGYVEGKNAFFQQLNSTSLGVEGSISGNNGNFSGNVNAKTLVVNPNELDLEEGTKAFEVFGDAYVNGAFCADDICEDSDIRLKRDFAPINNASNLISQIKGYYHYWIDPNKPERQIGVIAQELEIVFPELVHTKSDGFKAVNYSKLTAVLIEAFKEQQAEIDDLQKQINSFKQQANNYDTLKAENEQLSNEIREMRTMMKYIIDQMQNEPSGILKTENINE